MRSSISTNKSSQEIRNRKQNFSRLMMSHLDCVRTKGHLISELLFDVLNFPKNQRKHLMNLKSG